MTEHLGISLYLSLNSSLSVPLFARTLIFHFQIIHLRVAQFTMHKNVTNSGITRHPPSSSYSMYRPRMRKNGDIDDVG